VRGAAMTRSHLATFALLSIAILAGCVPTLDGLPRSISSKDRATVYEAVYVHKRAVELYEEGKFPEAVAVGEKAVELLEQALGPNHIYVAVPLRSLAVFLQTQGAYAKAEPLYERVIALQERDRSQKKVHYLKARGKTIDLARSIDELAALYMQWGTY